MTDNSAILFLEKLNSTTGFFVDVGANDGQTNSMTFDLEKNGWKGILIEPNPLLVEILHQKRTSPVINCAVSSAEGQLTFNIVHGPGNLHGLSRFDYTSEFENHVQKHGGSVEKMPVQSKRLENILQENACPKIFSFLKVDVEGHELEVFKSLNFDNFSPVLIVAEDNTKDQDKRAREFLKKYNYVVIARIGTNNYFVRQENLKLFPISYILAKVKFMKWDAKRFLWKLFGREFVSKNI